MVVLAYNLSIWEAEAGDSEFKVSLGYIVRPCLKRKKVGGLYL
jgi:hypothetical protein